MQMGLRPAIMYKGEIHAGERDDSHITLAERKGIPAPEEVRGFTPDTKTFLNRKKALGWMKFNEPKFFAKVQHIVPPEGLHSEDYAKVHGITQKKLPKKADLTPGIGKASTKPPVKPTKVDLSDKVAIVYDRGGLYLYCAEVLARKYKKVYYFLVDSDAYPSSIKAKIGECLNVERIHDFWPYVDKCDIVYCFDCYDSEFLHWLRDKGYNVFGSARGGMVEVDKIKFLETLEELDLPCAETYLAEGVEDLERYLEKNKGPMWLKNLHRGDFETRKYSNMKQIKPFLDDLRKRLGTSADDVQILVQHKIDSVCEIGYDGFCINGDFTEHAISGYEIKDRGFVGRIQKETPPILKMINDKFSPIFKEAGYYGNYSTEVRIAKNGDPYFIDPTCRVPSPPGELMCEIYENWAEATWEIAQGIVPILKPVAKFGAVIIMTSEWHNEHELCVQFPSKIAKYVKLKNHTRRGNSYYCIPNGNGGFFGAVIGMGDTLDEAIKMCLDNAELVEADEFNFDPSIFDAAKEQIEGGKKYIGGF